MALFTGTVEDKMTLVAIDLDAGEEAPPEFTTARGHCFQVSEVEDIGDGRRLAWYFRKD